MYSLLMTMPTVPPAMHRKATTSLAPFDVHLLRVWYDAVRELHGAHLVLQSSGCNAYFISSNVEDPPLLAIMMHDFEKVDVTIMQDVFYILRYCIIRHASTLLLTRAV